MSDRIAEAVPPGASSLVAPSPPSPPRGRVYLRLLWLLPALALIAWGAWLRSQFVPRGSIDAVKLTVRPGPVGQAADVKAMLGPNPDLYIKLQVRREESSGGGISGGGGEEEIVLPRFKDTPVGNGLTWKLPSPRALGEITRVDVWDHHTLLSDSQLDRVNIAGRETDGQTFHITLEGTDREPPPMAMPALIAGAALAGVVLLRFVWDQAI